MHAFAIYPNILSSEPRYVSIEAYMLLLNKCYGSVKRQMGDVTA